jgi:hypothetical protein
MFRAYLGPSTGGTTVCIQQFVLIILVRWLSVVLVGLELVLFTRNSGCGTSRSGSPKADSHIACRAHVVPLPCRSVNSHMPCRAPALLRQCRVLRESPRGSRKYSNCSSNSLANRLFCSMLPSLLTVVGMDPCEEDWYASDNNLRGTQRRSWKYPNAGR